MPQIGCKKQEREKFWSEFDEVVESISMEEKVVIGTEFNGSVSEGNRGDGQEQSHEEYKEIVRKAKREVVKAKLKPYNELYESLETKGEDLYHLARQRDQARKDVQQVWVIKDKDGNELTSEDSLPARWKEYFNELNEENERERRLDEVGIAKQEFGKISKDKVRKAFEEDEEWMGGWSY